MKNRQFAMILVLAAAALQNCTNESKETVVPPGAKDTGDSSLPEKTSRCLGKLSNHFSDDFARTAVAVHAKAAECEAGVKEVEKWLQSEEKSE